MSPYNAAERRVLDHDPDSNGEQSLTRRQARALVAGGRYLPSSGSPLGADHFRRRLHDGSCLHLVVEDDRCRLHHDAFDPDAGLFSLCMHAAREARYEAMANVALAWCVIRHLSR